MPTLRLVGDDMILQEGEDDFAYVQLNIADVPTNGLEGVIEYNILVSSGGASEC